jgi:hypothetical protein
MDERSRPRVGALDCPALGLVLQLTALIALPGQLSLCVAMVLENQEPGMTGPIALQLVAAGLQIATGVAVARRASARPLFAAWCVAALAAAVSAAIVLGDSDIALVLDAELFEIVAGPVMVLFAPLVIDVERLSDQRSPADVAAALLVLAMASLLALPLEFANYIRLWGGIRAASPGLLTSAPEWAPDAVLAIITLHAGRVLLRPGPPAAARKALVLYVVVSIAVGALHILGIVNVARGGVEGHATMLLSTPVIGLAIAVARPLLIWAYARPVLREPIAVERRALAGTLLWGVLWSVPLLVVSAGRAAKLHPESDALTIVVGALLCGQAICARGVAQPRPRAAHGVGREWDLRGPARHGRRVGMGGVPIRLDALVPVLRAGGRPAVRRAARAARDARLDPAQHAAGAAARDRAVRIDRSPPVLSRCAQDARAARTASARRSTCSARSARAHRGAPARPPRRRSAAGAPRPRAGGPRAPADRR